MASEDISVETSLVVQWFRFCASKARGMGSIPGGGTKIPRTKLHSQKNKQTKKKQQQQKDTSVDSGKGKPQSEAFEKENCA